MCDAITLFPINSIQEMVMMAMMMMNCSVVWLTEERRLTLFPAWIIVKDPYYRESPARHEQYLNLCTT